MRGLQGRESKAAQSRVLPHLLQSPFGLVLQIRAIRQTIIKLENKVQELEKQQITIMATPLPEESEWNPGCSARGIVGIVVPQHLCWPGMPSR